MSDDDISNAKKELEQETREDLDEDGEDEDGKYFLRLPLYVEQILLQWMKLNIVDILTKGHFNGRFHH